MYSKYISGESPLGLWWPNLKPSLQTRWQRRAFVMCSSAFQQLSSSCLRGGSWNRLFRCPFLRGKSKQIHAHQFLSGRLIRKRRGNGKLLENEHYVCFYHLLLFPWADSCFSWPVFSEVTPSQSKPALLSHRSLGSDMAYWHYLLGLR